MHRKRMIVFSAFLVAIMPGLTATNAVASLGMGFGHAEVMLDWGDGTDYRVFVFRNESELGANLDNAIGHAVTASLFGTVKASYNVFRDPSIAHNLEVTSNTTETQDFISTVQFPINPLAANTLSAQLLVDLIDANSNGQVALTGTAGSTNAIQTVAVTGGPIGPPLGAAITTPGVHSFVLDPVSGPTPTGNMLFLRTSFSLSPGDTAHIISRFIIDEHTGIPFAEIPDLPDPADGPFFNVIDINSPETSLGNNARIGAQTQLNLMAGGSIGEDFSAGDPLFLTPDIEVNISGGTMGDDFRLFNESVANISGGTTADVFTFGNSELNVSGGNVGFLVLEEGSAASVSAGVVGGLNIREGAVNISGGTVGGAFGAGLRAEGGVTTISGGTIIGSGITLQGGDINISGGTIDGGCGICAFAVADGSVVNISGGSFKGNVQGLSALTGTETVFNIYGGTFSPNIYVSDDNELHFYGTEFLLDGVPIDGLEYGEAFEITNRNVTLTGLLADGSPLSVELNSVFASGKDHVSLGALLTVTLVLPGDYNDDGTVNAADYVVWRNNVGTEAALPNDITPWSVTDADHNVWRKNFGTSRANGATAAATVPEPSTLLTIAGSLLVATIAGGWRCKNRR
jgi:hypothetical protein